jgi:hypothetical protein
MTANYKEVVEQIDLEYMRTVIERSKLQTSQIIIVPRFVSVQSIYGVNEKTIVVESKFQELNEQLDMGKALWQSPSLHYIAFYSKDVAPFLRLIASVDKLYIRYHTYIVNGIEVSIATELFSDKQVTICIGTENLTTFPSLLLIPYQDQLNIAIDLIAKWKLSKLLPEVQNGIDLNNVEDFVTMCGGLASAGAMAVTPSKSLIQYTLYLSKTMFSFNKSDDIKMYIATEIPGEPYVAFMAMIDVNRVKKKLRSNHKYYILGYKMI